MGNSRFKVAICGAGIGGLTAAVALSAYPDIEVEIFEAAREFGEVGAGVGLFSRPWEIIKKLGLEHDLLKTTDSRPREGPVSSFKYRKSDRHEGIDFHTLVTNGSLMAFHRVEFQKVLLRRLPKSYRTTCSKRLRSYTQHRSGPIELLFEDGSTTTCDALIGADGLKSAVRRSLLNEKAQGAQSEGRWSEAAGINASVDPVWSGTNAYRALIPADRLRARAPDHRIFTQPSQYLGKNGYIIAYPISHGKMINFVAFSSRHDLENTSFNGPWVSPSNRAEFASIFAHWEPEVQALIDCVDNPLRWAVHTVRPLGSFVSGRVALLGDAAHAMTPHQGSGAGQAIEDAYILAQLLGHPRTRRESLWRAFSIYDEIRRPTALKVMERSRLNGQYFSLHVSGSDFDRLDGRALTEKLQLLGETFTRNWEWAWSTSAEPSVQEALRRLES